MDFDKFVFEGSPFVRAPTPDVMKKIKHGIINEKTPLQKG
jgi:hypothetical protein